MAKSARRRGGIVVLRDWSGVERKLVRIAIASDSTIMVSVPYHPADTGRLFKIRRPTILSDRSAAWSDTEASYHVDVPIKMSLHPSGFVQFTAVGPRRIRSGETRPLVMPKGLGIHSHPFTDPIDTGPTFGVHFYDIRECEPVDGTERARLLRIDEQDMYHHQMQSDHVLRPPNDFVTTVEGHIFSAAARKLAFPGRFGPKLRAPHGSLVPDRIVDFLVVDLPTPLAFLGLLVVTFYRYDPQPFGYYIGSPADLTSSFAIYGWFPDDEQDDAAESSLQFDADP